MSSTAIDTLQAVQIMGTVHFVPAGVLHVTATEAAAERYGEVQHISTLRQPRLMTTTLTRILPRMLLHQCM